MKDLLDLLKIAARIILAGLLCIAGLFWIAVGYYCVREYATNGIPGVKAWLMHISTRPSEVSQIPDMPDWSTIGLQFAAVAVITSLLWIANRRPLARINGELKEYRKSLRNPPADAPSISQRP